jgi:hypothetical protein
MPFEKKWLFSQRNHIIHTYTLSGQYAEFLDTKFMFYTQWPLFFIDQPSYTLAVTEKLPDAYIILEQYHNQVVWCWRRL